MTKSQRIRVLIADDNRAVRIGMRLQLDNAPDIEVVGEVGNGIDAVMAGRSEQPDVILMDLQMPGMSGVEATKRLLDESPHRPAVIVMTSFALEGYVRDALDAGAVGYLLKSHDSERLVEAIRTAHRGDAVVSTTMMTPVLREFVRRGRGAQLDVSATTLSAAELRVTVTLARGITSNEDIAQHLCVSVHTVRSHLQSALKKTGLSDRTQLALWAVRQQLSVEDAAQSS